MLLNFVNNFLCSGYVLSREALNRFVEFALKKKPLNPGDKPGKCKTDSDSGSEDAEIGFCLQSVNVRSGDSRDPRGQYTFFPFDPETHLNSNDRSAPDWYWHNIYYPTKNVSKHHISEESLHKHKIMV